jgi:hypothetical protein
MESVEERVAYVEGRVEEHRDVLNDIRTTMDLRFDAVDRRFEAVDRRFERMEAKFDRMDDKMTRLFLWGVGIYVTTLSAAVAAILGAVLSR